MSRNYYKKNLRGQSFKDEDLKGANFCKADIRGVDFTNADLTNAELNEAKINGANFCGANLTNAKLDNVICGLKTWWTIFVAIMSLSIISFSAFTASIIISCNFYYFLNTRSIKIPLTFLMSVIYITIFQGYYLSHMKKIPLDYLIYPGVVILIIVGVVIPFIVTMDEPRSESKQIFWTILLFSILVVFVNLYLLNNQYIPPILRRAIGAIFGATLGIIISYQAIIIKDKKFIWIWNFFVYITSLQGTKFHNSNLESTSFVNANLKGSHFSECILKKTNWYGIEKIECSRVQANYLENSKIRDLVITKRIMRNQNYNIILKGLNLDNADLSKADLSKADLSNSTLKNAILKDSNLSETQLDNVDLSGAEITGAIIEKKSIPSTAKVDGLICKYFYPKSNPEQRYPIIGEFTSEEAIKVLQKQSKVVLLFEQDGIDWQAFLQAFENTSMHFKISHENSEKLIQAFERKLDNNFIIRLNVPNNVSKIEFEHKLKEEYKKVIENLKTKYRNVYHQNNINITDNVNMLQITKQLAYPGNVYIHNIVTTGNNIGNESGTIMTGDNIKQTGNFGIGVNKGEIKAEKLTGNINEAQQKNLADAAIEIHELLKQLEKTNPTLTETEKIILASKAADEIRTNPTLKARVIGALKLGGKEAFKEAVDNPLVNILIAIIEGWQEA